jgi:hypothetical protein
VIKKGEHGALFFIIGVFFQHCHLKKYLIQQSWRYFAGGCRIFTQSENISFENMKTQLFVLI